MAKKSFWAKPRVAEVAQVGPPSIGLIAEEIRRTLVDKFDTYFPVLNMETQNDGKIVLRARDQASGMNFEVELRDLNQSMSVTPEAPPAPGPSGPPGSGAPAPGGAPPVPAPPPGGGSAPMPTP